MAEAGHIRRFKFIVSSSSVSGEGRRGSWRGKTFLRGAGEREGAEGCEYL